MPLPLFSRSAHLKWLLIVAVIVVVGGAATIIWLNRTDGSSEPDAGATPSSDESYQTNDLLDGSYQHVDGLCSQMDWTPITSIVEFRDGISSSRYEPDELPVQMGCAGDLVGHELDRLSLSVTLYGSPAEARATYDDRLESNVSGMDEYVAPPSNDWDDGQIGTRVFPDQVDLKLQVLNSNMVINVTLYVEGDSITALTQPEQEVVDAVLDLLAQVQDLAAS